MRNKNSLWPWAVALVAALLVTLTAWIAASGPIALSTALLLVVAGLSLLLVDLLRRQAAQNIELQRTRRELRQARERAEAPPPADGELMTHLRQYTQAPLRDILGVLDQLETMPLSGPQRSGVRSARASAQHLSDLFADPQSASMPEPDALAPSVDADPTHLADSPLLEEPKPVGFDLIDTASYTAVASMMAPDALEEWLASLFDPPEGSVHLLVASLAAGDATRIVNDASKLKGSAMLLGFEALVRTSAQIERLAREDNPLLRRGLGNQLLTDMARTQQAMQQLANP